ncbi:aldehyde dehydrogenase family protein, partial [Salmonella enterica]|uniref:aldehyde dehydrogenase family protein n=1 Tax=Salmonella enterica TaxID=28901 RepID=UPI000CBD0B3D
LGEVHEVINDYYKDVIVGDPTKYDIRVGPMVSASQKKTVLDYIEKGKEEGAKILLGGNNIEGTGYYVEPTVFTDVKNNM